MSEDSSSNSPINIGSIGGDFVYSNNQSGGATAHNNGTGNDNNPKKKKLYKRVGYAIMIIAALATIFAVVKPIISSNVKQLPKKENNTKVVSPSSTVDPQPKKTSSKNFSLKHYKKMSEQNKNQEPISIGNVTGDVVISQNQTGGVTAHTYVGNPQRHLTQAEKNDLETQIKKLIEENHWDKDTPFDISVPADQESNYYANEVANFVHNSLGFQIINYNQLMMITVRSEKNYQIATRNNSGTLTPLINILPYSNLIR